MSSLYGVVSHFWRIYSTALLFFIFGVSFLESCDDYALIVQNLKILLGSIILVETKLTRVVNGYCQLTLLLPVV